MKAHFELNWKLILILLIPVWALVLFCIWAVTHPAIQSIILSVPLPSSWTWVTILFMDIGFAVSGIAMSWGVLLGFSTEITENHIKRHLFLWQEEIRLKEIKQMVIRNYRLILIGDQHKFSMSLLFYKHPEEVLNFIRNHIPIHEKPN